MIFERIVIERFGQLADVDWELGPGLRLIFGLNEAGKTTVLQAIRALLYDMFWDCGHTKKQYIL